MNAFDQNLKRLRIQRNLKQEDLAELLHVTRQTISGWETGRRQPDLDTLTELAEVLAVDVHELIYGCKPGTYPKFQRKHVICTAVFGGIVVILLLLRLLLWPYRKIMANSYHWGTFLMICTIFLPQAGAFAFGLLIPALIQLRIPIPVKKRHRPWYLLGGILASLPVILFWFGISPWSKWILYRVGNALLRYILPAISGICIMLHTACEQSDSDL